MALLPVATIGANLSVQALPSKGSSFVPDKQTKTTMRPRFVVVQLPVLIVTQQPKSLQKTMTGIVIVSVPLTNAVNQIQTFQTANPSEKSDDECREDDSTAVFLSVEIRNSVSSVATDHIAESRLPLFRWNRTAFVPQISVVLPIFNAEATIGRAIKSILEQASVDLELIVVDDGSADATQSVVRNIRDSRVKLVCDDHQGVASAANTATSHAQADILARMDADDVSHPRRLEQQLQALTHNALDGVGCQVRILNSHGRPTETLKRYERWINSETISPEQIHALRFVEFPLVNPTITARRSYFELGFENDDLPEDYDLLLRAMAKGLRFGKVAEVLLDWTDGDNRLTRTDSRYSTDAFMRCRRQHLLNGPLSAVSTVDLWGAGQTGKPWLRWLQSRSIQVRKIVEVNPRKIGKRIHNTPVIHADTMMESDGVPLIVAVGSDGARHLIQEHIAERGFVSGQNAWFVA